MASMIENSQKKSKEAFSKFGQQIISSHQYNDQQRSSSQNRQQQVRQQQQLNQININNNNINANLNEIRNQLSRDNERQQNPLQQQQQNQSQQKQSSVYHQPQKKPPKKDPISKIMTSKWEEQISKEQEDEEKKMRYYNKKLTLAQKLGLIEAPPKPLSQKDWQVIEEKSKKRQDSEGSCAICLEDFKEKEQVILSCSHTFHKFCLASFEKHNKIKTCPICRIRDYDKKTIDDGFKHFVIKCCVIIQKTWRGSKQRKMFLNGLIEQNYKASSMYLRRRIMAYKIMKLNQKVNKNIESRQKNSNDLINNLQKNIEQNKLQVENDISHLQFMREKNKQEFNEFLMYDTFATSHQNGLKIQLKKQNISSDQWQDIQEKSLNRQQKDCAICFNELKCSKKKDIYLLSCTHMFHANCLNSFERYNITKKHTCPICRAEYEKIHYTQEQKNQ